MNIGGIFLLSAYILSGLGSGWLIWRCKGGQHLLKRQMLHLAVADLGYSLLPNVLVLSRALLQDFTPSTTYCKVFVECVHFCELASALVELHIAAGLFAALYQRTNVLHMLGKGLWLVWPLATIIAIVDWMVSKSHPTPLSSFLDQCANRSPVCAACLATFFVVGMVLYTVGLVHTCSVAGGTAATRAVYRVICYPLNFLLTYGLLVVYNFFEYERIAVLAFVLAGLNGTINAVTYQALDRGHLCVCKCFRNRPRSSVLNRDRPPSSRVIFPVTFCRTGPAVSCISGNPSWSSPSALSPTTSNSLVSDSSEAEENNTKAASTTTDVGALWTDGKSSLILVR